MYISKKLKKMIAASLTFSGLTLMPAVVPAFYPINTIVDLPIVSVTHAKVTTYTGVGEDYANEYESQEIAKQRARSKAIRQATEQAGVYLQTYSKSINGRITNDEINAITSNSYKIDGEPVYERIVQQVTNVSTVIIWKATVQVNVDDAEIQDWLKLNSMDRSTIVNQNNILQESIAANDKQVENLRQRAQSATNDTEREAIRTEYKQIDNEFLANQKNTEGLNLQYQKNYDAAIERYNEAIALQPNDAKTYYNRGGAYASRSITYGNLHDINRAIDDFNKAIQLAPTNSVFYTVRGGFYAILEETEKALDDLNKAIQLNQNNVDAYVGRGLVYVEQIEDYNRALTDFNKALTLDPNYDYAYNGLGEVYDALKDYKRALSYYNKAIELNPYDDTFYYHRAITYDNMEDYKNALADYTKAIELNPNNADAYYWRAECYKNLGDNTRANADFVKAKQLGYIE